MKKRDAIKRYGLFLMGVIVSALGISLITKAGLGTSPITSLAYVLTFIFPQSLGTFTMLVNSAMFVIQILLLGENFQKIQLLQLPAALLFSMGIDLWMLLLSFWSVNTYMGQLSMLLLGCVFLGLGVALEVIPNVLVLPGEGVVRTIAGLTGRRFGRVKTEFDMTIVVMAAAVSLSARHEILGIREGTVMAALLVGRISHFFLDQVSLLLGSWLPAYGQEEKASEADRLLGETISE